MNTVIVNTAIDAAARAQSFEDAAIILASILLRVDFDDESKNHVTVNLEDLRFALEIAVRAGVQRGRPVPGTTFQDK